MGNTVRPLVLSLRFRDDRPHGSNGKSYTISQVPFLLNRRMLLLLRTDVE